MSIKTSKKEFEFLVPVTNFSKKTQRGFPNLGELIVIGEVVELKEATKNEDRFSANLSHIIWQDVNILPLVKATRSMHHFHLEMIEYSVNLHLNTLKEA